MGRADGVAEVLKRTARNHQRHDIMLIQERSRSIAGKYGERREKKLSRFRCHS